MEPIGQSGLANHAQPTPEPRFTSRFDWRTISALNVVSALAQVGQFGIAFVMLPVWLAAQGLDATRLGVFVAALWLGQLPGLALAPRLCRRHGERRVITAGLLCTVAGFAWIALLPWPLQIMGGSLAGMGLGLRWIGLEPWLYRIAPSTARGRLVGFHETLIALAPIAAPLLVKWVGIEGHAVLWVGAAFSASALAPLLITRAPIPDGLEPSGTLLQRNWFGLPALAWRWTVQRWTQSAVVFKQGLVIAAVGGVVEAAVSGLFALYTQEQGLSVAQTAELLAVFGLGGLLLQYPVGWLSDHWGVGTAAVLCAAATAVLCAALTLALPYAAIWVAVFLLGGCITAFLTLALIASTLTPTGSMADNVSAISMTYTLCAAAGPLMAAQVIKASNGVALMGFASLAAIAMVALLLGLRGAATQDKQA